MNPILEKKIERFKSIIFDEIKEENSQLITEGDAKEEALVLKREKELKEEAQVFYKKRMEQTEDAVHQMISNATLERNKIRLNLRREILNATLDAIAKKAIDFSQKEEYQVLIKQKISYVQAQILKNNSLKILAREIDKQWLSSHIHSMGYKGELIFDELPKNEIAGVIITFSDKHIRYNITLKNMIDEKLDHIGAQLYVLLEEMED